LSTALTMMKKREQKDKAIRWY
jgi:hypothetical protein